MLLQNPVWVIDVTTRRVLSSWHCEINISNSKSWTINLINIIYYISQFLFLSNLWSSNIFQPQETLSLSFTVMCQAPFTGLLILCFITTIIAWITACLRNGLQCGYNMGEQDLLVNPFPNTPFWDCPKFKEAAENNWNVAIKDFKMQETFWKKVKLLKMSNFTFFHNAFPKLFYVLKWVNNGGKG